MLEKFQQTLDSVKNMLLLNHPLTDYPNRQFRYATDTEQTVLGEIKLIGSNYYYYYLLLLCIYIDI